jgi:hypothetical protein
MVGPPSSPSREEIMPDQTTTSTPLTALALRVFWMMLGPAALFALAVSIALQRGSWAAYAGYGVAAMLVLAARYLDISRFDGTTDTGAPATMEHFHRYAKRFLLVAAAAWGLAQLVR